MPYRDFFVVGAGTMDQKTIEHVVRLQGEAIAGMVAIQVLTKREALRDPSFPQTARENFDKALGQLRKKAEDADRKYTEEQERALVIARAHFQKLLRSADLAVGIKVEAPKPKPLWHRLFGR